MSRPLAIAAHAVRTQQWLKDPQRKPYRVTVLPVSGLRIARFGELVLGAFDTHAQAFAAIARHAAARAERAA